MEKKERKSIFPRSKADLTVYVILRLFVILTLIYQAIRGNFENVFMCGLTLVLFTIPVLIDRKFNIQLPDVLEAIILLFIFSAQILGEVQNFYGIFEAWDVILHTINGFLCAAIGFSLIDIMNRSEKFHLRLDPIFVSLVAFCFSMTIGVVWEFLEYGLDIYIKTDTQKDVIVRDVYSVFLNEENANKVFSVNDIDRTVIYYLENGEEQSLVIQDGYLDLGLHDTMDDLWVNFIGAVVFSIIGLLYIKDRDGYKFAENFIPILKKEK